MPHFRLLLLALLAASAIEARAQTTVNLIPGWTLLGNSSSTQLDVVALFGNPAKVNTVWKWIAPGAKWAFYTPTLADGGAVYAAGKGYDLLASVGAGEGFWVNAKTAQTVQLPAGVAVLSASFQNIAAGWNLIAIGDYKAPWQFNNALNLTPPTPGVIANNLTTLWAWDAAQLNWYFYAPSLDANGTLAGYISGKRYLNFGCAVLGPTTGFWINVPAGSAVTTTPITTTTAADVCPAAGAITAAAAIAANDTATKPTASLAVVQNAGIPAVILDGPPKVNFTVISNGAVVKNLTTSNVSFIIAQLVPGTNGTPDQWKSYTHRTETATAGVGPGGTPALTSAVQAATDSKTATQLVYNDAGYYTYSFSTDIKDTAQTNGVVFDPSLTHRIAIQLSYANAAGATVRVNPYFDFTVDASGNAVAVTDSSKTRKVVDIGSCNECHGNLALHGGGRVDTQYCVLCHNAGTTDANSGNVLDLRIMAHKIHAGERMKQLFGNDYTVWGYRDSEYRYAEVTYPQPITNCTKCHDNTKAAQADNWKSVPSRAACGACHAGINFATGLGATMANAQADLAAGNPPGTTATGHIGGAKADDSQCALCHGAVEIPIYHVTVDPTGSSGRGGYPPNTATNVPTPGYPAGQGPSIPLASQLNLPAGAYKIDYEIKQVTVSGAAGAKKATVVYRILKDGLPVILNTTGYLIDNVDGTPSIFVAYAVPQDGIAAPADWNATKNATVTALRDGTSGNFQTGPDANGYYTATLGAIIPDDATMVSAGLGLNYNGFVQLNLAAYPKGIRLREPQFVMRTADGYAPRRSIVSNAKCNNCHGQLGVSPSFHSGARNNGKGCAFCHDANRATGHIGAANSFGGGWSVASKNLIHGIHGSSKREQAFSYEATSANPGGFQKVTYPGVLKNCEQCHVPGSYDFSAAANQAALPKLLWTTDAKGNMSNPTNTPSIGLSPWVTILGAGQVDYTADNLVSSPIASTCFGCHDSTAAVAHMQSQGGTLLGRASTVAIGGLRENGFNKFEACMVCHNSTSNYGLGIKAVHEK